MKWINRKDHLINKDHTVIKAEKETNLPGSIKNVTFPCGYSHEKYKAEIQEGTGSLRNEADFPVFLLTSEAGESVFRVSDLKHFIQKKSKFYVSQNNGPAFIQNQNFCCLVSPSSVDNITTKTESL